MTVKAVWHIVKESARNIGVARLAPHDLANYRIGGFAAEFSVEEHDADGVMETEFYLPDTFPTQESAIEAAIKAGRQKIDVGFERGSAVVNG